MVTTVQGDRFTGAVLGIGADGWLHLNGPQFGGEVTLAASVVAHVEFAPARDEKAGPQSRPEQRRLTSSDRSSPSPRTRP